MENLVEIINKKWKQTKGITLIALVVTIIVLLILAGITISLLIGKNGIIAKATQSKIKQENAQIYENLKLKIADKEINKNIVEDDFANYSEWLQENGWIDGNRKVNVEKVVGKKLSTGNGTEKDIYKVEIEGEDLVLNYYNKDNEKETIGPIIKEENLEPTSPDYFDFTPETGEIALKDGMSYYGANKLSPITTIVIPLEIDGVPVTTIGNHYVRSGYHHTQGFNASNIRKIIIPEGITNIVDAQYDGAFSGAGIRQITIPSTIKRIGSYAFGGCEELQKVILKEGLEKIGAEAFKGCYNLKEIRLPSKLKVIEEKAFSGNEQVSAIEIPNTVTTIGKDAFNYMKCVIYPKGTNVETGNLNYGAKILIDENVQDYVTIDGCIYSADKTKLYYVPMDKTEVNISEGVTTIAEYAFYNCGKLTNVTIPNSVAVIEDSAFAWCTSLTSIELPNSVTQIGNEVFEVCRSLKDVKLSENLTTIGSDAFYGTNIDVLKVPSSVTTLSSISFQGVRCAYYQKGCKVSNKGRHQSSLYVDGDAEDVMMEDGNIYNTAKTKLCVVNRDVTEFVIPNTVQIIDSGAFWDCEELTQVTIPDTVKEIGNVAFQGCSSLTSIKLPKGITKINKGTFSNSGLRTIELTDNITSIGNNAFYRTPIKSIVIPDNVTYIGEDAFDSSQLENIQLGKGIASLSRGIFQYCKMKKLELPEGIINIEAGVIEHCFDLKEIIIPSTVTSISNSAFIYSYLEKITIKAGSTLTVPTEKWGANNATVIKE